MTIEFKEWPKIARLNRDIVITEKIDGTNAALGIVDAFDTDKSDWDKAEIVEVNGTRYAVYAQSRSRIITPTVDNHGFATWAWLNAEKLAATLGPGLHFGEWWGSGIQRRYGLNEKRFSLFNTPRYTKPEFDLTQVPGLGTVPVLYEGMYDQVQIDYALNTLRMSGSIAAPGFMDPEGIVIFHTAAQTAFKVTLKNDGVPKALVKE